MACCDLDVAVAEGRLPVVTRKRRGSRGDRRGRRRRGCRQRRGARRSVVIPFQISCGQCRECRRGITESRAELPLMAMYGMAPLPAWTAAVSWRIWCNCRTPTRCWKLYRAGLTEAASRRCRTTLLMPGVSSVRTEPNSTRSMMRIDASSSSGRQSIGLYAVGTGDSAGLRRRLCRHRPAAVGRSRKARRHSA